MEASALVSILPFGWGGGDKALPWPRCQFFRIGGTGHCLSPDVNSSFQGGRALPQPRYQFLPVWGGAGHCLSPDINSYLFGGGGRALPQPRCRIASQVGTRVHLCGVRIILAKLFGTALSVLPLWDIAQQVHLADLRSLDLFSRGRSRYNAHHP